VGIGPGSRCQGGSTYDSPKVVEKIIKKTIVVKPGQPNPIKFETIRSDQIGTFLIVELQYEGCTNYNGRKILVYENITLKDLNKQGHADPHFSCTQEYYSPIARFKPDTHGWHRACYFARMETQ
jgi:hypothetical protein